MLHKHSAVLLVEDQCKERGKWALSLLVIILGVSSLPFPWLMVKLELDHWRRSTILVELRGDQETNCQVHQCNKENLNTRGRLCPMQSRSYSDGVKQEPNEVLKGCLWGF